MTTTLVLRFDKHEIRIRSPEAFENVSVLSEDPDKEDGNTDPSPEAPPSTNSPPQSWFVSLAHRDTPTIHLSTAVVSADTPGVSHPTPPRNLECAAPQILVHPIYTPRLRDNSAGKNDPPGDGPSRRYATKPNHQKSSSADSSSGEASTVNDSDDDDDDNGDSPMGAGGAPSDSPSGTKAPPPQSIVHIPGLGGLMPYTASMYRSSTLSMAQSILEITYRPTGRLAWSRLCPRLNLTKDQSERTAKEAMVTLVATRLAKCGIITESFPPEGSRRVWLVPLDHSETHGSYVVIAKSRGRKLRVAMKETFSVEFESGKRGLLYDHFLAEVLARNLWWLSAKPVEIVVLPRPLYQSSYWINDYGWSSVTALIADCNQELGTNINMRSNDEFMEIVNQRK